MSPPDPPRQPLRGDLQHQDPVRKVAGPITSVSMRRLLTTALITATAAGALAPAALAASATQDGYGPEQTVTPSDPKSTGATEPAQTAAAAPTATSTGTLPFTGTEAALIGIAGLGLVGVGLTLRRAGRQTAHPTA